MPHINFKDEYFEYEIIRKENKNIGIRITNDGIVRVTAPSFVSTDYIHEVVYKRADWILSKLKLVRDIAERFEDKRYTRGDSIVYLGEEYKLKVIEEVKAGTGIKLKDNIFEIYLDPEWDEDGREKVVRIRLEEWYRRMAFNQFKERTRFYAEVLKLYPNNIRIKEQKSIWGSCSSKNNINFNWKLIMAPKAVFNYIVVHELCHLRYRDHSKNFWGLVEKTLPEYKEMRNWLKENGRSLKV